MMPERAGTLIKVGGSLYDLPELAARLRTLLTRVDCPRVILFPGGGAAADMVRDLDRRHGLGQEAAHWLALRALTVNAFFLQDLLPEIPVMVWPELSDARKTSMAILEPYAFAVADENNPGNLPHSWEVTSDSLAARAAHLLGVRELLLLKSMALADGMTWLDGAKAGVVDAYFPRVLEQAPGLEVRVVNFRDAEAALEHELHAKTPPYRIAGLVK